MSGPFFLSTTKLARAWGSRTLDSLLKIRQDFMLFQCGRIDLTTRMDVSRAPEAPASMRGQHNPGEPVIDQLFDRFAFSLTQLARNDVDIFLARQEAKGTVTSVTEGERVVLDVVAGHEVLGALSTALLLVPQGPLTQELYPTIVRHRSEFTIAVNSAFPQDLVREQRLAQLVRMLRASLHLTPRR